MGSKGHSVEALDRNEEYAIGNWRKDNPYQKVAKYLTELCLCPSVLWKAELKSDKLGYLAENISKQVLKMQHGFS